MFGGGSTTYYTTSTMPLYDENTAGMLKQSIVSATASNRSLSGTLLENILNSDVKNIEKFYKYGASGKYQWGLAQQYTKNVSIKTRDYIEMIISKEQGEAITVTYVTLDQNANPSTDVGKEWTIPATPNLPNDLTEPNSRVSFEFGSGMYYIVEYVKDTDPDVYYLWWFNSADATPDNFEFLSLTAGSASSPYYPIIPFRVDGERWDDNPLYKKDIRKACRYLGLNPKELGDNVQKMSDKNEHDGKPNPLEEAYIYLGVPLNTTSKVGKEYLFRYFEEMSKTSRVVKSEYDQWEEANERNILPPRNNVTIEEENFTNVLSWSYIKESIVQGNLRDDKNKLLKNGSYTTSMEVLPRKTLGRNYFSDSSVYYRRQNSNGTYTQVEIRGLGFSSDVVGKTTYYTAEELFEPEDATQDGEKVTAPLHREVFKQMGKIKGHDLINVAVRMQLNDKLRVKHKTNWFSIIVFIVQIVITILYPPVGATLHVLTQVAIKIAVMLVMQALTPVITKILQDVFGEELGAVLAVIVAYYATGKLTNAITSAATTAEAVVKGAEVVTTAVDTAATVLTTTQYVNLALDTARAYQRSSAMKQMKEYTALSNEIEKEIAEIEKLNDLIGFDDISGIVVASQLQDTNKILGTNLYVANTLGTIQNNDLLIRATQDYTDAMRYTGRVYSPINSARILA